MVVELIGIVITFIAVAAGAWFLGNFMVTVFTGERTFLHPVLRPVEVAFYRLSGIKEDHEQSWILYTVAMLAVQVVSFVLTYVILRLQDHLPLNPMGVGGVRPRPGLEHDGELRHQHQLAELHRRADDVLPLSDAGARHSQLPLGG